MANPIHHPRHLRIICVGAGVSGLCFAYKLQRSFQDFSLTVFEKNKGISGTWFENKYPGCACDAPAHNYTYSFEPKPDFSQVYAPAQEIRGYFEAFARKYGLNQYIETQQEVIGAEWNADSGEWHVRVKDLVTDEVHEDTCNILVNATGILNKWRWPDIPGLEDFKGPLLHSAHWNQKIELEGKRVGLIGNGASGQQILETIQPIVGHLTTFIRQPNWMFGPFGPQPGEYTKEDIEKFIHDPATLLDFRKENERRINGHWAYALKGSEQQAQLRQYLEIMMRERIKNKELEEILIPKWSVSCRRPTPGIHYLERVSADNVNLVLGDIQEVQADGCIDKDGCKHPLDVLICATGFDTSYKPGFPVVGEHGKNLQEEWQHEPKAYMATAAAGYPNYLMFHGPNNAVASGPILAATEFQADYILKWCNRWQTENIQSFSPKAAAVDDFVAHCKEIHKSTVWSDECKTWYKQPTTQPNNSNVLVWPGSVLHYIEAISEIRGDDFDVNYSGNRFAWLGNGFSQVELDPEADLGYYIRTADDSPYLSREKSRKALTHTSRKSEFATTKTLPAVPSKEPKTDHESGGNSALRKEASLTSHSNNSDSEAKVTHRGQLEEERKEKPEGKLRCWWKRLLPSS